jgi:type I restriction enzyme, S subunit
VKKGWERKRLGDVCRIARRQARHKGLPYVGLEHIEGGTGKFVGSLEPTQVKSNTFAFDAKSVLFGRLRPYLKKVLLPSFNGHCSTEIFPLQPSPTLAAEYLHYWFLQDSVIAAIAATCTGARMPRADMDAVMAFPIPVPPLPEQRRIVAILDEAFEGIAAAKANAEKNLRNARTVFESYRDATFTSLEQEASLKPLEDMVDDIATGPFGSLLHKSDYEEGGIPLVNPINIEDDVIVPDERKAISTTTAKRLTRYRLKAGDIAVGRRGDIGRCAVVSPEQDGWLCGTGCFVIRAGKGVSPDFLAHLLRSRPYRMQLVAKAGRATMPSISNKDLADLQIPAVSPERQKNALEGFGELSAYSSQAEEVAVRKLAALDELKASLLHQAFTGAL